MLSLLKLTLLELRQFIRLATRLFLKVEWAFFTRPDGFGNLVQIKEEGSEMSKVFTYSQGLLPVKAGVDSQRLVVTVDGVETETISIASDATAVEFKAGPEGATVKLSLDYLDAAGNDSDNVEFEFVVVDQVPPETPDGFGKLAQIAEEEVIVDPDPEDETPVEDPVTDDTVTDENL